jgi:hypothetical protein
MNIIIAPTNEIVPQDQQGTGAIVTDAARETDLREGQPSTPSTDDDTIEIVRPTSASAAGKATASGEKAPAANKPPERTRQILMPMTTEEEGFRNLIAAMNEQRDLIRAQNERLERLERYYRRSPSPVRRRHDSPSPPPRRHRLPTPPPPRNHSTMPQQSGRHQLQLEDAARLPQSINKSQRTPPPENRGPSPSKRERVVVIRDSRIPSPRNSRQVGGTFATAEHARRDRQKEVPQNPPRRRGDQHSPPRQRSSYHSPPVSIKVLLDTRAIANLLLGVTTLLPRDGLER